MEMVLLIGISAALIKLHTYFMNIFMENTNCTRIENEIKPTKKLAKQKCIYNVNVYSDFHFSFVAINLYNSI